MTELLKAKSEFRKKGVVLVADKEKSGAGGSWKFVSEDQFIKTIQKPLTEAGLELFSTVDYKESLGVDVITVTLFHSDSGQSISSSISMSTVEPRKDRNGNPMYLDAEIERGKQFGYWSRILSIRILGLSDIDPESMDKATEDLTLVTGVQIKEIEDLVEKTGTDLQKVLAYVKRDSLSNLTVSDYAKVIVSLKRKLNDNSKS